MRQNMIYFVEVVVLLTMLLLFFYSLILLTNMPLEGLNYFLTGRFKVMFQTEIVTYVKDTIKRNKWKWS